MIKAIKENITLENVKNSNYWDLIAILVWNHYSEKRFQDESNIKIVESWCGKHTKGGGAMFSSSWNDPNYIEKDWERTLYSVKIIFTRTDYTTHIHINVTGNISVFGIYADKSVEKKPSYYGLHRTLNIVNWLLQNNFVEFKKDI